ncbi:MAG: CapA family protein [Anaerolineales bacterium]|nr:CapA family protein [Anaerolineales bacterium]
MRTQSDASVQAAPLAQLESPKSLSLWVSPGLPAFLRDTALAWGLPITTNQTSATISVDLAQPRPGAMRVSTWIYALVAPFPTVTDGITADGLRAAWKGSTIGPFAGKPLLMDQITLNAFTALWGRPAPKAVKVMSADQLLDTAWSDMPSWAIIPFEALDKKWKVLTVDGQSPIHKEFDPIHYALAITYRLTCADPCPLPKLPSFTYTNRDPAVMSTLIMTGVTALVRGTATVMERKGITYPGRDLRDVLREADITHISNEIPFFDGCKNPSMNSGELVFCSKPKYIGLLTDVGTDVVELTGNHFADYGAVAMKQTLGIYKENNLPYFAGGMDDKEAKKPLLMESNGNKFAFIGCNRPDTGGGATATKTRPGAAPCDFPYMTGQIRTLSAQGYIVITTFQWNESYNKQPHSLQVCDFEMMSDAGADIVSGSQAHYSQTMEFHNDSFIHFGLGNMFFDQMDKPFFGTRREFMDRYVVYDGKLISVELMTNMLMDYSRPRSMTQDERRNFLTLYFTESGWLPSAQVEFVSK